MHQFNPKEKVLKCTEQHLFSEKGFGMCDVPPQGEYKLVTNIGNHLGLRSVCVCVCVRGGGVPQNSR